MRGKMKPPEHLISLYFFDVFGRRKLLGRIDARDYSQYCVVLTRRNAFSNNPVSMFRLLKCDVY